MRRAFSTLERIHTPIMTPMIPPLPVVRMEFRGTSALYRPSSVEMVTIWEPMEMPPIMPPRAGVAPNSLAALMPV